MLHSHAACYGNAVFDMIEFLAAKSGVSAWLHQRNVPLWIPRMIYRSIYVVFVAFIAILLPFFGGGPVLPFPCAVQVEFQAG